MKFWRTHELRTLRTASHKPRRLLAVTLGRTQRSVTEQARRVGVRLTGPLAGRWPAATVARARSLRAAGEPLSAIATATGVPFGTLRHWFYSGVREQANG